MIREDFTRAILEERNRQVAKEGWSDEHDDEHNESELAWAACYYACPQQPTNLDAEDDTEIDETPTHSVLEALWPPAWSGRHRKKRFKDRKRQLVVAGALIVAELERLERGGKP